MSNIKKPETVESESPLVAGGTPLSAVATADDHSDAPMTSQQGDELRALAERAGEPFDGNLTRRQAAERIAYLKSQL